LLAGGNWNNVSNAGAGCANLNNTPWNVNNNVGLLCVCDTLSKIYPTGRIKVRFAGSL